MAQDKLAVFCDADVSFDAARAVLGQSPLIYPKTTMLGAMAHYVAFGGVSAFVPMNANFGIIEPLPARVKGGKVAKNEALAKRALEQLEAMKEEIG